MKKEFNNLFENPVGVAFGAKPIFKKNKMKEEFNLSENIYADGTRLLVEDVKEFIRRETVLLGKLAKGEITIEEYARECDKLAGEELSK